MTSHPETPAHFSTTHWSLVLSAQRESTPEARAAVAELCERYWYPLYAYLRDSGHSADEAQDFTPPARHTRTADGLLVTEEGQPVPPTRPVMEINPDHPIVERLKEETDDQRFSDWTQILFDQALLAEGGQLDDPAGFVKRLNEQMLAMAGGAPSRIWTPGG